MSGSVNRGVCELEPAVIKLNARFGSVLNINSR